MIEEARVIKYSDSNYHKLMDEFKMLSTYEDVVAWDQHARTEVDTIIEVIKELDSEITGQTRVLEHVKREHAQKSFLKRIFGSRKSETEATQFIEQCYRYKATLEELVSKLQESIDFTPNSPEDQKILLKELRLRKKELQSQKREVATSMKAIRNESRVESVHAGKVWFGGYDRKLAEDQRRRIRYAREAALGPREDIKAAIERQLIRIEKDIMWAERFN